MNFKWGKLSLWDENTVLRWFVFCPLKVDRQLVTRKRDMYCDGDKSWSCFQDISLATFFKMWSLLKRLRQISWRGKNGEWRETRRSNFRVMYLRSLPLRLDLNQRWNAKATKHHQLQTPDLYHGLAGSPWELPHLKHPITALGSGLALCC